MNIFCKIILPLLCIISCSERKEIEVYNMELDENKKEVLVEIRNNTENNYYLLFTISYCKYNDKTFTVYRWRNDRRTNTS